MRNLTGRFFTTLAIGLIFFGHARAAAPSKAKYLKLGKVKALTLKRGDSGELIIPAEIESGYHIQSNPPSAPNLIATELTMEGKAGLTLGAPVYPEGKGTKLSSIPQEIKSYEGKIEIKVPVKVNDDAKAGTLSLVGKLRYQACTDKTCYFPMTVPVSAQITVK